MSLYPANAPTILPREDYDALLEYSAGARAVLEFGPGVSTSAFFENVVLRVVSYGHDMHWYRKAEMRIRPQVPRGVWWELRKYNATTLMPTERKLDERYDMAFVDAPPGGSRWIGPKGGEDYSRWNTLRTALTLSNRVLLHDANRRGEQNSIAEIGCQHKMLTEKMALCWM